MGGKILSKKRKSGVQYRASIGMSRPEEAEKCIKFLNQTKVEGHKIKIQKVSHPLFIGLSTDTKWLAVELSLYDELEY